MAKKKQTAPGARPRSRPGLGKGLGALIGDPVSRPEPDAPDPGHEAGAAATGSGAPDRSIRSLPLRDLRPNPWQPRQDFDEEALKELTDSIQRRGILQPLLCRRRTDGGVELVAGERRLRAARAAGLETVPVIFLEASDSEAAEMALIENLQREDLNVIEEAEGYRILAQKFNLTQQEVAERVGKARSSITNALRLLDLPGEVKQFIVEGRLSSGHAKALLGLETPEEQRALARRCVEEDLSVRALETLLRRRATPSDRPAPSPPVADIPAPHLELLADRLRTFFGTHVKLQPTRTFPNGKHGRGSIEIEFYDHDDLDRILELLNIDVDTE